MSTLVSRIEQEFSGVTRTNDHPTPATDGTAGQTDLGREPHAPGVEVRKVSGFLGLFSLRAFAEGQTLFELRGVISDRPTMYSVQVGENEHLSPPADVREVYPEDGYLWRFLNHSCAPSTRIEGRCVVAARALTPGEQLTFNYDTTEWLMSTPFVCACGHCGGRTVAGFSTLRCKARHATLALAAEHIRAMAARQPSCDACCSRR